MSCKKDSGEKTLKDIENISIRIRLTLQKLLTKHREQTAEQHLN